MLWSTHLQTDENNLFLRATSLQRYTKIIFLPCHNLPQQIQLNLTTPLPLVSQDEEHHLKIVL